MAGKGARDKMKGQAKEVAGKATGNDRLKREGRTDQVKGKVEETVEDARENLRDAKDSLRPKRGKS
ncbi:CsbD family protein [Streptomyces sp. NPDC002446]